jgi:hypothetical protein
MNCYYHPENEAVGICKSCQQSICKDCVVDYQGKLICRTCMAEGKITKTKVYEPNNVFLIELICGFFGLLGIGYLYVGRTNEGIVRLICWLIYDIIATIIIVSFSFIIVGLICIPFQLILQIGIPIWSAYTLKNSIIASQSQLNIISSDKSISIQEERGIQ